VVQVEHIFSEQPEVEPLRTKEARGGRSAEPRSGTRSFSDATNLAVADLMPFKFLDESGKIVK
jgi:hypothetical protein